MMVENRSSRRYCFGCGDLNPHGLKLEFRVEGGKAVAEFIPRQEHQGYPGIAHGGVTAAALDEAMGWAMYAIGAWAVTGRMEVRFRQPLPLHRKVVVSAEVSHDRGRWLEVRGEVRDEHGRLMAESQALFLRLPQERARELEESYAKGQP